MLRAAEPADAPAIARVYVASWRTTYPGILPDGFLAALDVDDYTSRWWNVLSDRFARSLVLVQEEGEEIVGFASCGRERDRDPRYEGELYAIYLLVEAQRRGHGRALVQAAARALAGRGMHSMVVWVLRENTGARAFYERLGGRYLGERPLDLRPDVSVTATEVSYVWPDTASLLSRRCPPPPGGGPG
jgi:ribosomal protein S18 acetylase RimI-like enzyme